MLSDDWFGGDSTSAIDWDNGTEEIEETVDTMALEFFLEQMKDTIAEIAKDAIETKKAVDARLEGWGRPTGN
jgi:hypothetical protein